MRKHFLILMLMALLPLTGWAETTYTVVVNNNANLTYKGTPWTLADLQSLVKIHPSSGDDITTGITVSLLKKNGTSTYLDEFEDVGTYTFKVEHATAFPSGTDASVTVAKCPVTVKGALQSATTKVFYGEAWDDIKAKVKATYDFTTAPFNDQSTAAKRAFVKTFTDQFDGVVEFPASASTYVQWTTGAAATFTFGPTVVELNETYTNFEFTAAASAAITVQPRALSTGVDITVTGVEYDATKSANVVLKDKVRKVGTPAAAYSLVLGTDYTLAYYPTAADAAAGTNVIGTAPTAAGTYYVKISGANNYGGDETREFTISKASVDIETLDKSSVYGDTPATLAAVYGGWVNATEGTAAGVGSAAFVSTVDGIGLFLQKQGVNVTLANTTDVGTYDIVALPTKTGAPVNNASDNIFKNYEVLFFNSGKYTVTAKPLTVTIKNQTKKYGIPHILDDGAEVQVDADNFSTFFEDFWSAGKVGTDQIATYPKVKRDGDKVVIVEGTAFAFNRNIGTVVAPVYKDVTTYYNLTINDGNYVQQDGQINVKAKSTTITYGDKENLAVIELNVSGGDADDMEAAKPYLIKALKVNPVGHKIGDTTTPRNYPNAGVYELYFDEDILEANQEHWAGYTIKAAKSTYTINKRRLTNIKIANQSLNQGDATDALALNQETVALTAEGGYKITDDDYNVIFGTTPEIAFNFNLSEDDGNKAEIVASHTTLNSQATDATTLKGDATVGTYVKAIKIQLVGAEMTNFALPLTPITTDPADTEIDLDTYIADVYEMGELTVSAAVADLASLVDTNTGTGAGSVAAILDTNKGKKVGGVDITLNRNQAVGSYNDTWEAKKWNAMILPFDITVEDLVDVIGYCIVNVASGTSTVDDKGKLTKVSFKLEMDKIPANTPFMVKTSKKIYAGTKWEFGTQTIANFNYKTADPEVDAGAGNKFVGTYKGVTIDKNHTNWRWNAGTSWPHFGAESKASYIVRPFCAYMQIDEANAAHEIIFEFEELDGSTTAINSIDADFKVINAKGWYTINGIKLNAAPTEKGIYINNGKKVVVK